MWNFIREDRRDDTAEAGEGTDKREGRRIRERCPARPGAQSGQCGLYTKPGSLLCHNLSMPLHIGSWRCGFQFRAVEAIPLHEQTLAARERVPGPDHPDTLTSRNNLAAAYRAAGRAD
jgi:hypothetical protein